MEPLTPDQVLTISGVPPERGHVAALACDGDVALALVAAHDPEEPTLWVGELQWSAADGWHEEPIGPRDDVLAAGGMDPGRGGGTLPVQLLGRTVDVPVSPRGWWMFVARVDDQEAARATWVIGDHDIGSAEPDVADADDPPAHA